VGLVGLHVTGVERTEVGLRVDVESGQPTVVGCPSCGVVAHAHGRQTVELIDAPCFAAPVRLWWRKRRFRLTDRQHARLESAFVADERHVEVEVAWRCAQQVRSVYHQTSHAAGRRIAEQVLADFHSCPIPEIARLGRTLNQWRDAFLGYFTTGGANNGGTEAVNGLIELARRVARGFRDPDNYRLRMLLIGGGLRL
jgi:transposase